MRAGIQTAPVQLALLDARRSSAWIFKVVCSAQQDACVCFLIDIEYLVAVS